MTDPERDALLTLCIRAAYADGLKDERERAEVKRIAESLGGGGLDLAALHQEVLLGRRTLEAAAAALQAPELRQLAYELAVCVCDADGVHGPAEEKFLSELQQALKLDPAAARAVQGTSAALASAATAPGGPAPDPAALDKMILDAAILNGALELLPESLSSMAIIPLQMRLVYRVGKAHGVELDRGSITELLATVGVGLTSQYLEQVGRKVVGGLLRALGGRLMGGLGKQAVSSGMAFASTYALGQVARRYYAGGRTLDARALREAFESMLADARGLGQRHAADIEARARTIDVKQLIETVRNG